MYLDVFVSKQEMRLTARGQAEFEIPLIYRRRGAWQIAQSGVLTRKSTELSVVKIH